METRTLTLAGVISRANNPMRHVPIDFGPPARMTDEKLVEARTGLNDQVLNIGRQLADDLEMNFSRGDAWRKRAMGARRVYLGMLDKINAEGIKRGLITPEAPVARGLNGAPLPSAESFQAAERKAQDRARRAAEQAVIEARKMAEVELKAERVRLETQNAAVRIERQRIAEEKHAAMLARHAEVAAAKAAKEQRMERHFINAAVELLGIEACREIWARANEMAQSDA